MSDEISVHLKDAVETVAAGDHRPSKSKLTERIDGIVATVMGLGRTLLDEGECEYGAFLIHLV